MSKMQPITTSERKCVIKGCGNISMFKQSHQFPSMPERCLAWLDAIGDNLDDELIGLPPEKFKRRIVCVDHFDPSCISKQSQRFLKRTAIPSIFNGVYPDGTPCPPHPAPPLQPRPQLPVNYRTIVIPKNRHENKPKSFYINKTSEPATQPTGPTLLIEPLGSAPGDNHKNNLKSLTDDDLDDAGTDLPLFYMSSHHAEPEKGKPALKITKVYPNRKPGVPNEPCIETLMVEEDLTEYLDEEWGDNQDSDQIDGSHMLLDGNQLVVQEGDMAVESEDWTVLSQVEPAARRRKRRVVPTYIEPLPRCTLSTPRLPAAVRYVLLGGGEASMAALTTIRKHDPAASVLIVMADYAYPYKRHLMSKPQFWTCNDFSDLDQVCYEKENGEKGSIYYHPPSYYVDDSLLPSLGATGGVGVARGYVPRRVDRNAVLLSAAGRPDVTVQFASCLIDTGCRAASVPVLSSAEAGVRARCVSPRSLHDARELWRRLGAAHAVAVVGAGYHGTELCSSIANVVSQWGQPPLISHVFREAGVMWRALPDYLSRWSTRQLVAQGVRVVSNTEILNAYMKDDRVMLELSNAEVLEVDLVVVCAGSVPDVEFAAASGLELHPQLGGVMTDEDHCVRSNLYAAGEAACQLTRRWGRRRQTRACAAAAGRACGAALCGRGARGAPLCEVVCRPARARCRAIGVVDSNLEMMGAFPNLTQLEGSDKNYDSGVVFYLQQREVVGVLLWNLPGRRSLARKLLSRQRTQEGEINELADMFIANVSASKLDADEYQDEDEIGSFQCEHCKQEFPARQQIINHLRDHHPQTFTCEMCQTTLSTLGQLRKHYSSHLKPLNQLR